MEVEEEEEDPFEGEELLSLQFLEFSKCFLSTMQEFICGDDDLEVCSSLVDPSDPEWRAKGKEALLVQIDQDPEILEEIGAKALCVDDKERALEINSNWKVLGMAEKLLEYARFTGNEKLSLIL